MGLKTMKTEGIIFEETVIFRFWLYLMRSVLFHMIFSRWLEVMSSVLMDVEILISIFAKMLAFEYLDCVLFFSFGCLLGKVLHLNSY